MHVRAIARAIGSDSHKTWNMVERLKESGLVVKRDRIGGRKYASLNRGLPIHRLLKDLLLALDKHWPAERVERNVARWHMPFDDDMSSERTDHVFQSPVRSRVLLFVQAIGTTNMETISKSLGIEPVSVLYAVNHWEREGIVKCRKDGPHRLVTLDPDFVAAAELKLLLREIVAYSDEYKALRKPARQRIYAKRGPGKS